MLGTNRHESRRIDDQLRGRAGRQGDPGSSRFFISLEDDLLVRYGIERLIPRRLLGEPVAAPLESPVVRHEIDRAQRIVEGESFATRKRLRDYSDILEDQRSFIQEWRQEVLEGRAAPGPLAERCGERRAELDERLGAERHGEIERRLTLLVIDRCWSEYLTELQAIRDEIHLVGLDGRDPLAEYYRTAIKAFEQLLARIEETLVETYETLEVTEQGVDWEAHGLRGPSATWTYLVGDQPFGANLFRTLANRASIGLWGVLLLWPVLFAWGLYLRWKRRRP